MDIVVNKIGFNGECDYSSLVLWDDVTDHYATLKDTCRTAVIMSQGDVGYSWLLSSAHQSRIENFVVMLCDGTVLASRIAGDLKIFHESVGVTQSRNANWAGIARTPVKTRLSNLQPDYDVSNAATLIR